MTIDRAVDTQRTLPVCNLTRTAIERAGFLEFLVAEDGLEGLGAAAFLLGAVHGAQPFRSFVFVGTTSEGEGYWLSLSGESAFDSDSTFQDYRSIGRFICVLIDRNIPDGQGFASAALRDGKHDIVNNFLSERGDAIPEPAPA